MPTAAYVLKACSAGRSVHVPIANAMRSVSDVTVMAAPECDRADAILASVGAPGSHWR
jgi:hypothetical protein